MKKETTILLVDDNPENLGVLAKLLAKSDRLLTIAQDGAAALETMKDKRPDLILLDIMMPGMNGFETCKRLKQDATLADIPIIFLTALQEKEDVIAGLKLGAVDYVTKPFNEKELLTRVNTHLELQAVKEELRESIATRDKLFSIISHDLGGMFAGMQSLAQLLTDKKTPPDAETREKWLKMLMQSATNGYELLTNLLNWSRAQTGKLQTYPTKIILQYLIVRNIELQRDKAKGKEIEFVVSVDEKLSVFADVNMFNTVLRNLISNAIKFTEALGTIRVFAELIENNLVEISVSDTGIGIKPEDIDKLFKINIDSTYGTAGEKGNGLGLVLCKDLIEQCGGTIGVESVIGEGSRFYVCLPIVSPKL